jgi:hypothetical protein
VLLGAGCLACGKDDVSWSDPVPLDVAVPAMGVRLAVDDHGRPRLVPDSTSNRAPADPGLCPGSFRVASLGGKAAGIAGVWWSIRADSSAILRAAVSADNGQRWGASLEVDTLDVSVAGCSRPAPAIAASMGFVHLAYSMKSAEGTGVFYAHSMTEGRTFEPPMAIIYGQRLTPVSISAEGGTVAVAYEDPNGSTPQIGLALSREWGHIFLARMRASGNIGAATSPHVAVTHDHVVVSWAQRMAVDGGVDQAPWLVRVGRLQ